MKEILSKKRIEILLISILDFCVVYMLPNIIKINESARQLRSSILTIPLYIAIWILLKGAWTVAQKNRRVLCWSLIAGVFGSAMLTLGRNLSLYDGANFGDWCMYATILCEVPLLASLFVYLFFYYDKLLKWLEQCKWGQKLQNVLTGDKRFFLIVWLFIFVSWIPAFLSAFPGIYGYDSIFQVNWFMEGVKNGAHPILHTFFLGGCIKAGEVLFSSHEAGLFMYSMIQMTALSAIFAYSLKVLCKHLPGVLIVASILFYGWMPYNVLFSFSSTKDVLFAGFFLIVVLKTYEIAREPETFFLDWKKQICYMSMMLLMFAFRHNGYYTFLCMVPFFLFYNRRYWKKALLLLAGIFIMWNLYIGPVHRMLGYSEGISLALLCIPTQQLARTLIYEPEVFTKEEEKQTKEYLTTWESYSPRMADFVKEGLDEEKYTKDPSKFLKLWISIGIKAPGSYANALLSQTMGYWYPDMQFPDWGTFHPYMEYENMTWADGNWIFIERTSYIPALSKIYNQFAYEAQFQNLPLFALLCSPGFAFWMMCVAACRCIVTKRYHMLLPCSLMFGLWLSIMMSSLVLFRYAYPLMLCIPILICIGGKENQADG